jgi:hypothetical protein
VDHVRAQFFEVGGPPLSQERWEPIWYGVFGSQLLPLEGTWPYLDLLGCNRWPVVLEVRDPDKLVA